jgi:hypothetical protein
MAVDTLAYVTSLEGEGIERRVAEAHPQAMLDAVLPNLATKHDFDTVEQRLGRRIDGVEAKLDAKIVAVDAKIDRLEERMQRLFLQSSLGTLLGVLAIGGFLIRFAK